MCNFLKMAKTLSFKIFSLNDLIVPGPSRPSSLMLNPPIPWDLDALGPRMSDFGIFATQWKKRSSAVYRCPRHF